MNILPQILFHMDKTWISNAFRFLFAILDNVIYFAVSSLFQVVFEISEITFTEKTITDVTGKLYAILTIFMFFKIAVSLITYLVNPDTMADKQQGAGKLLMRVVLTIVMLAGLPIASNFIFDPELNEGIIAAIPRLIIGKEMSSDTIGNKERMGQQISWTIYSSFVFNNPSCPDTNEREIIFHATSNGKLPNFPVFPDEIYSKVDWLGNEKAEFTQVTENINLDCSGAKEEYRFEYNPIISTICGGFLAYILLGFAINVGVRIFKLLLLRIIAPIPIVSFVDPKSSKDGPFQKWLKAFFGTWAELYLYLAVIYFVVYLVSKITTSDAGYFQAGTNIGIFTIPFLILGLFFFAKQAPKFIADSLGIKGTGFEDIMKMSGAAIGIGAAAGGALGAGISGFHASRLADNALHRNHNIVRNIGAGLFGMAGTTLAGMGAALGAKDHNTKAALDLMRKRNDTALAAGNAGSTFSGRVGSTLSRYFTGDTEATKGQRALESLESQKSALEAVKSRMQSEMVKQDWTSGTLGKNEKGVELAGGAKINYKAFAASYEAAKAQGQHVMNFRDVDGNNHRISLMDAEYAIGNLKKENEDDYLQQASVAGGAHADAILVDDVRIARRAGATVTDRKSVNGGIDQVTVAISQQKADNATAKANDQFSSK